MLAQRVLAVANVIGIWILVARLSVFQIRRNQVIAAIAYLCIGAKQLFFCNLTESDLRSDSPVV